VPAIRKAIRERRCKVGTMDTWVVWVCDEEILQHSISRI